MFSYWGYEWVNYLLSKLFKVETTSTLFNLMSGLISMISSVIMVIGVVRVWKMQRSASRFFMVSFLGFLLANFLDIVSEIYNLSLQKQIETYMISGASWSIGLDLLEIGFWAFVLIYFTRKSFKECLS